MNNTSNVTNTHNGHGFVDLGLPSGTLWATCNVGATSPEQAGLYFAFGETTGYSAEQVKKGERSFDFGSYDASSISDNLTLEQDAAHVNLGEDWRVPSKEQFEELTENCDVTWIADFNGTDISGLLFTSKINGNSLFFPAVGYCYRSSVYCLYSDGYYRSASWDSSSYAWGLYFDSGSHYMVNDLRCCGCSVRGVCKR